MKFVLISCLIVLSQQYNQKPQPESDWSYELVSRPERACNCIPKASTVEFTPIVKIEVTHNTQLNCDAKSKFKNITDHSVGPLNLTCNGVVVTNSQNYNFVIGGGNGGKNTETLTLTNYTRIISFNNGNVVSHECGIISGGKCSGDTITGTGIFVANDKKGCCKGGITGLTAVERQFTIKGECASSCSLGTATWVFAEPVSNYGLVDRT